MNRVDFHIDEPIVHDATIEQHMDFNQLMKTVKRDQQNTSVNSISNRLWVVSIGIYLSLLSVLGFVEFSATSNVSKLPNITQNIVVPETPTMDVSETLIIIPTKEINKPSQTPLIDDKQLKTSNSRQIKVSFQRKNFTKANSVHLKPNISSDFEHLNELKLTQLDPIKIPNIKGIPMKRPNIITTSDLKILSGIPISLDLITYTELKKVDYFYFELLDNQEDKSTLQSIEWEYGDLGHHSGKSTYSLTLVKDNIRKLVVVRLIKGGLKSFKPRKKAHILKRMITSID